MQRVRHALLIPGLAAQKRACATSAFAGGVSGSDGGDVDRLVQRLVKDEQPRRPALAEPKVVARLLLKRFKGTERRAISHLADTVPGAIEPDASWTLTGGPPPSRPYTLSERLQRIIVANDISPHDIARALAATYVGRAAELERDLDEFAPAVAAPAEEAAAPMEAEPAEAVKCDTPVTEPQAAQQQPPQADQAADATRQEDDAPTASPTKETTAAADTAAAAETSSTPSVTDDAFLDNVLREVSATTTKAHESASDDTRAVEDASATEPETAGASPLAIDDMLVEDVARAASQYSTAAAEPTTPEPAAPAATAATPEVSQQPKVDFTKRLREVVLYNDIADEATVDALVEQLVAAAGGRPLNAMSALLRETKPQPKAPPMGWTPGMPTLKQHSAPSAQSSTPKASNAASASSEGAPEPDSALVLGALGTRIRRLPAAAKLEPSTGAAASAGHASVSGPATPDEYLALLRQLSGAKAAEFAPVVEQLRHQVAACDRQIALMAQLAQQLATERAEMRKLLAAALAELGETAPAPLKSLPADGDEDDGAEAAAAILAGLATVRETPKARPAPSAADAKAKRRGKNQKRGDDDDAIDVDAILAEAGDDATSAKVTKKRQPRGKRIMKRGKGKRTGAAKDDTDDAPVPERQPKKSAASAEVDDAMIDDILNSALEEMN